MHRNNLAIESQCSWGAVEKEPTVINLHEEPKIENSEQPEIVEI